MVPQRHNASHGVARSSACIVALIVFALRTAVTLSLHMCEANCKKTPVMLQMPHLLRVSPDHRYAMTPPFPHVLLKFMGCARKCSALHSSMFIDSGAGNACAMTCPWLRIRSCLVA